MSFTRSNFAKSTGDAGCLLAPFLIGGAWLSGASELQRGGGCFLSLVLLTIGGIIALICGDTQSGLYALILPVTFAIVGGLIFLVNHLREVHAMQQLSELETDEGVITSVKYHWEYWSATLHRKNKKRADIEVSARNISELKTEVKRRLDNMRALAEMEQKEN